MVFASTSSFVPSDPSTYPSPTPLVRTLLALRISDPKLIKPTLYTHSTPTKQHQILSWKMPEHLYRIQPCPLPTLARGLFTEEIEQPEEEVVEDEKKEFRIVARGYEKFFNIGEVPYTDWESLTKFTVAPYHLTLKSNGCLILISAIEENVLLVTSKHAMGESVSGPEGAEGLNHAQMGRVWLEKHLAAKGRTEEELARVLWDQKLTAVAELCDDSFEEHVLPYPPHLTGLHLHGLNLNVAPDFFTLPPSTVSSFATEWGFIPTRALVMNTLAEVRSFTQSVEDKGEWEGEPVEGFVVRCTVAPPPNNDASLETDLDNLSLTASTPPAAPVERTKNGKIKQTLPPKPLVPPPYPSGSPFFFKIKFEQPYLRYRGFREITKALLPLLEPLVPSDSKNPLNQPQKKEVKVPRSKLQDPESVLYESWCRRVMETNPEWFEGIKKGKGIVAVRERFLEWCETEEGSGELTEAREKFDGRGGKGETMKGEDGKKRGEEGWGKTILFPVAVPGCGKTAIGLVLSRLFGFGHSQSDDVTTKKTASTFNKNVGDMLKTHDVVYADRNNQLEQHRSQLSTVALKFRPKPTHPPKPTLPTRLIALHWPIDGPSQPSSFHEIHRICSARVLERGSKHQSLRVDPLDLMRHEAILWRFIDSSEEFESKEADETIELKVQNSLEENLAIVIERLAELMGLEKPEEEKVEEALEWARGYDPEVKKEMDGTKSAPPRYYALAPEIDVVDIVRRAVAGSVVEGEGGEGGEGRVDPLVFLTHLIDNKRIIAKPHVTLIHEKEVSDEREAAGFPPTTSEEDDAPSFEGGPKSQTWSRCVAIAVNPSRPLFAFKMHHLIWNERIMALSIEDVEPDHVRDGTLELPQDDKDGMHVTVGTRDMEVAPFEARKMVREFREGKKVEGVWSIDLKDVESGKGRVKGLA